MFAGSTAVVDVDLRAFTSVTSIVADAIKNSTNISVVRLPYSVRSLPSYAIQLNNNYQGITCVLGDEEHGSDIRWFQNYNPMRAVGKLVIFSATPPYWSSNSSGTKSTPNNNCLNAACKIYVPDSAVETYKNSGADMWGSYASRIYPISEWEG